MDKILLMLQLQASLNESTNGAKWVDGVTKNGKTIDWKRCIYMECAEMIDSFSWKHWKNIDKEGDLANLQIEVVDVWHFVMSLAIERYSKESKGSIEDIAVDISDIGSFSKIKSAKSSFASQNEIIQKIEIIMFDVLNKKAFDIEKLMADFFELVFMSSLNLDSLYKLYVGKNILNQFRQDHGYKDGTYIKIWAGEEDNVVMTNILNTNINLSPDGLYRELTKQYFALNKS